jgi:hypothetical protein
MSPHHRIDRGIAVNFFRSAKKSVLAHLHAGWKRQQVAMKWGCGER